MILEFMAQLTKAQKNPFSKWTTPIWITEQGEGNKTVFEHVKFLKAYPFFVYIYIFYNRVILVLAIGQAVPGLHPNFRVCCEPSVEAQPESTRLLILFLV